VKNYRLSKGCNGYEIQKIWIAKNQKSVMALKHYYTVRRTGATIYYWLF